MGCPKKLKRLIIKKYPNMEQYLETEEEK